VSGSAATEHEGEEAEESESLAQVTSRQAEANALDAVLKVIHHW
jgi:hypothetical protein